MKKLLIILLVLQFAICNAQKAKLYWNLAGGVVVSGFAEGIGGGQLGFSKGVHSFFSSVDITEPTIFRRAPKQINFINGGINYQYTLQLQPKHHLFGGVGIGFNYLEKFVQYQDNIESRIFFTPNVAAGYKFAIKKSLFITSRVALYPTCVNQIVQGQNGTSIASSFIKTPVTIMLGFGK